MRAIPALANTLQVRASVVRGVPIDVVHLALASLHHLLCFLPPSHLSPVPLLRRRHLTIATIPVVITSLLFVITRHGLLIVRLRLVLEWGSDAVCSQVGTTRWHTEPRRIWKYPAIMHIYHEVPPLGCRLVPLSIHDSVYGVISPK